MNVIDSSAWIEYFADAPNAAFFAPAIADLDKLVVPSICIYEVYRHALAHRTRELALTFFGAMSRGRVIDLDAELATSAATLAHEHKLAMADAIILATTRQYDAVLWTQDVDLKGFEGVKYRPKAR